MFLVAKFTHRNAKSLLKIGFSLMITMKSVLHSTISTELCRGLDLIWLIFIGGGRWAFIIETQSQYHDDQYHELVVPHSIFYKLF